MVDISRLSPAECILLAEELWEKARLHPENIPVSDAQKQELARRWAAFEAGEMPTLTWPEAKRRLLEE